VGTNTFLEATLPCPECGEAYEEVYGFLWGFDPGHNRQHQHRYVLGEPVRWAACSGRVTAWGSFAGDSSANKGDPAVRNLRVGGGEPVEWGSIPTCRLCGVEYGGIEISVEDSRLASARRLRLDEIAHAKANWTYDRRAGWVAREDWDFHRMVGLEGCIEPTIVTDVSDSDIERVQGQIERRMMAEDGPAAVPRYAFLDEKPACPVCGADGTDIYAFWWGYCRDLRYDIDAGTPATYHLGDTVRWRTSSGTTPGWARFSDGLGINAGEPSLDHVLVMAGAPVQHGRLERCMRCGSDLGGVAIEIEAGCLVSARMFPVGEFDGLAFDHYTYDQSGSLVPHSDLLDHPLVEVRGD
jgi:hypothetical protein